MKYTSLFVGMLTIATLFSCSDAENEDEVAPKKTYLAEFRDIELASGLSAQVFDYADVMINCSPVYAYQKPWLDKHEPLTYENTYLDVYIEPEELYTHSPFIQKIRTNNSAYTKFLVANEEYSAPYFQETGRLFPCGSDGSEHLLYGIENCPKLRTKCYTATITGRVTIIADKMLFGKAPGEPLNEYFDVKSCLALLFQKEDGEVCIAHKFEELPTNMDEYFRKDIMLPEEFMLHMNMIPEEQYEEVTFGISMPIKGEYWIDYFIEREQNPDATMPMKEMTLQTSVTLKKGAYSSLRQGILVGPSSN